MVMDEEDLQLAAELGKTLLERNKELEIQVKELKGIIDEQKQEITYLKKHTNALREVNDTRLKVYEQLDLGIQELERANHRLIVENTSDKKHIKSLVQNIESLEARQDELTKQLEETRQLLSMERRKNERLRQSKETLANESSSETFEGVRLRPVGELSSTNGNESAGDGSFEANTTAPENCSFAFGTNNAQRSNANSTSLSAGQAENSLALSDMLACSNEDNEEIIKLVNDLEMTKKAFLAEQQRCTELEEQLVAIIQENQTLQSRLAHTSPNEEMKSMQEELSILDEVRQGKMCSRCLRVVEERGNYNDEQSSLAPTEECDEDEHSLLEMDANGMKDNMSESSQAAYRNNVSIKMSSRLPNSLELCVPGSPNPYRDLVEKYEALLEVQCSSMARKSNNSSGNNNMAGGMSLAEELQSSGDYGKHSKLSALPAADATMDNSADAHAAHNATNSSTSGADSLSTADAALHDNNGKTLVKVRGRTPTEYSEAETSSSGYVEETQSKGTQTEERPGSFLCTIGDGEVCKFSIYDDASPIDSHFRNRPEYRELFKEIFAVLKKAAANKEEGEKLPLLDDTQPVCEAAKVPPVTPANEELPVDFGDDTQSIISSAVSEQSFAMSECITKTERKTAKKHIIEKNQENQPPLLGSSITTLVAATSSQIVENGRVLTPLKREPLEYLSVGVGIKKKNRKKGRNFSNDRCESPVALPSPPRFFVASGKKRRDVRPYVQSPMAAGNTPEQGARARGSTAKYEWNGNSMVIYNRGINSPRNRSELDLGAMEYRPSTLSHDLHLLKKLDLSYAEVLRRTDGCKQLYPEHEHNHSHSHSHSHSHNHSHGHSPQQQQKKLKQQQQRQRKSQH